MSLRDWQYSKFYVKTNYRKINSGKHFYNVLHLSKAKGIDIKMKILRIYLIFLKNCLQKELHYRFNFFVGLLTIFTGYFSNILFFYFIYDTGIENISGWTKYHIYILLATIWIVDSIFGGVFFFNLIKIPKLVKGYDLDYILLKPVNTIFLLTTRNFNFGLFSGVFFGVGLLIYSLLRMSISVNVYNIVFFIISVFLAVIILFSILFIMVTFSLKFVRINGLIQMFWTMMDLGKQPSSVYPCVLRIILISVIPALIVYNFPIQFLLKSINPLNIHLSIVFCINLAVTILIFTYSIRFFYKSIKNYYN
ncbi:MAG: ABC-2 family transporter protein [Lachnospiraceae bacterium]|nr:ABC-2 family transporter protein [Lachnospiraceae bacterium]